MKPTKQATLQLWNRLQVFLFPDWHHKRHYRGDLRPSPELFELEDFYQKYWTGGEQPSAENLAFLEKYLTAYQQETDQAWAQRKAGDISAVLSKLETEFSSKDYHAFRETYRGDLPRLVFDGVLKQEGTLYSKVFT